MTEVVFERVTKRYGGQIAVEALDLAIASGEFVSFLGPSGSGKTTSLNLLAGLIPPDEGRILIGGRDVTRLPPDKRDIAMVFQNYALYPHKTVWENLAFPLLARRPRPASAEIAARIQAVSGMLGIDALLDRFPRALSGGQQQRVALGRGMIRDPKVFLLDEPLSNLDARLRVRMRRDIKDLHGKLASTIVYVTHDQAEAMTLSDRIAVFNLGRLQQYSTPAELYARPANLFVASFVGDREINLIEGAVQAGQFQGAGMRLVLPYPVQPGQVLLGVRAEGITLSAGPLAEGMRALTTARELNGPEMIVYARPDAAPQIELCCRADLHALPGLAVGDPVWLRVQPDRVHVFDPMTQQRLGD